MMPKTSWDRAPITRTAAFEGRQEKLADYFVSLEKHVDDLDLTPMFRGLPDDRCTCEHWGYVLSGTITYRTPEGDETFEAGDAFYVAPGHTHVLTKGSEMVEFSRSSEHDKVGEVVIRNMESSGRGVTKGWTADN
jgi:hypothetical protein